MKSNSEEDYLKAIFSIIRESGGPASTNSIAEHLGMKASSATDMVRKLDGKKLVNYTKYKGATLTAKGEKIAVKIIRKHRLWETFLVKELNFKWDEVHDIAEQLEHIDSPELVNRLDDHLGNPKYDPHGDPIPDRNGVISDDRMSAPLGKLKQGESALIIGVSDGSSSFLSYLEGEQLVLGAKIEILDFIEFDKSMKIKVGKKELNISERITNNLLVQKIG